MNVKVVVRSQVISKKIQLSSFLTCFGRDFRLFQQYLSELNKMENLYTARIIRPSAFSHLTDNASSLHPPPPGKKNCIAFVFASREIEDNAYAYAGWGGGQARCILRDM